MERGRKKKQEAMDQKQAKQANKKRVETSKQAAYTKMRERYHVVLASMTLSMDGNEIPPTL
ncbi:uncharacterized protein N7506_004362 [Penicillium brevicompactum]|uniref:uncharacterized protein n=1 Tax=Penicillium brevicompactum TaxID=5074 RepID=UPI00254087CA|nr:uncharacterized protein N7506_004362 [Penicillium brevicompactum]KAJ5336340.1 hypothetical protein N7506_004362 [Penicillium brevicompactum]